MNRAGTYSGATEEPMVNVAEPSVMRKNFHGGEQATSFFMAASVSFLIGFHPFIVVFAYLDVRLFKCVGPGFLCGVVPLLFFSLHGYIEA